MSMRAAAYLLLLLLCCIGARPSQLADAAYQHDDAELLPSPVHRACGTDRSCFRRHCRWWGGRTPGSSRYVTNLTWHRTIRTSSGQYSSPCHAGSRSLLQSSNAASCPAGFVSTCQVGLGQMCQAHAPGCRSTGFQLQGKQCCCCPPGQGISLANGAKITSQPQSCSDPSAEVCGHSHSVLRACSLCSSLQQHCTAHAMRHHKPSITCASGSLTPSDAVLSDACYLDPHVMYELSSYGGTGPLCSMASCIQEPPTVT